MDGQVPRPAPALVVLVNSDLGHRPGGDRVGDIHMALGDQVHQALVLAVGVGHHHDALGPQPIGGLVAPGQEMFPVEVGIGDHVVDVGRPEDGVDTGAGQHLDQLVVVVAHRVCESRHLLRIVVVVQVEVGGVEEGLLDVVDRCCAAKTGAKGHRDAVTGEAFAPSVVALVGRLDLEVREDVGQRRVVLAPLDGVLLDPANGGAGLPHLGGHAVANAEGALGRHVLDVAHVLLLVPLSRHPDLDVRR